jgi:hypothetical protein
MQHVTIGRPLLGRPLTAFGIADTAHDLLECRGSGLRRRWFNLGCTVREHDRR